MNGGGDEWHSRRKGPTVTNQTDSMTRRDALRHLPSISALLLAPEVVEAAAGMRPEIVTAIAQRTVERTRAAILAGAAQGEPRDVIDAVRREIELLSQPKLSPVINGTGVIIHTNLGRAPVSIETARAMAEAAAHYTPLELEIDSGRRGGRAAEITRLMATLTGAESTLVVNNNAAAILLVLSALCTGREAILSRSQAVEIGGGFRIPDVMAQSGTRLVEVGTTNRTYARDYATAITPESAALLIVHQSNFRIIGFTSQPSIAELADLAHAKGLVLIEDLGSGALLDARPYGLAGEPLVGESLAAGVDILCFSGDKLLGGPQAGIIAGRADLVKRVSAHPLARAVRADKTALAGVAATLRHYLRDDVTETVPVWRMISMPVDIVERRCRYWVEQLSGIATLTVTPSLATVGGGSLPEETLESRALAISEAQARDHGMSLDDLAHRLRTGTPPLMPRIESGQLLIDARTVLPEQDEGVVQALTGAFTTAG